MCGFAGEFILRGQARADLELARRMALPLACRGPDQEGGFLSPDGRCTIGFRRLAVIDVPGSRQPMTSPDGLWTVAYNGETYNFQDLRRQLQAGGTTFRTAGDTEVVLALGRQDPKTMPERLGGMFALALYRAQPPLLTLARDLIGQKPLYYALLDDRIVFASQPRSLLLHPMVDSRCSLESLTYYLSLGYIPAPLTVWSGIQKLPPGHILQADEQGVRMERHKGLGEITPDPKPAPEQLEQLRYALADSVRRHLVSDVPLGILLSGGIDSSILAALAAREVGRAGGVRTFTAGFDYPEYDERPLAAQTARALGTDHTELRVPPVSAEQARELVTLFDEPFADSSALPTWLICRLARSQVTVALGGEGGDEVFAGYDRYRAMLLGERLSPPRYAGIKLAAALLRPFSGKDSRRKVDRLVRFSDGLGLVPAMRYMHYRQLFRQDDLPRLLQPAVMARVSPSVCTDWFCDLYEQGETEDEVLRCQLNDLATYLPDDLLVKSDVCSMAVGLELRAPMLYEPVVRSGLALPLDLRISGQVGKQALRLAFKDMLPPHLARQPKRGFGLPLAAWLRVELRPLLLETLTQPVMQRLFQPEALAGLANDHLLGKADHAHRIWALMCLGIWLSAQPRDFA